MPTDRAAVEKRLERLAWVLDSSVRVPGTRFRIGLDSIVGLIPGIGDLIGALISLYLIFEARRLGLPRRTLVRMLGNVGLELAVGTIPIAGDLFDMAFRANERNVRLIQTRLDAP